MDEALSDNPSRDRHHHSSRRDHAAPYGERPPRRDGEFRGRGRGRGGRGFRGGYRSRGGSGDREPRVYEPRPAPVPDVPTVGEELVALVYYLNYQNLDRLDTRLQSVVDFVSAAWEKMDEGAGEEDGGDGRLLVVDALVTCAAEFVNNASLLALLVAILRQMNNDIGPAFLSALSVRFVKSLSAGMWRECKCLLIFMGELVHYGVVSAVSVLDLYRSLVSVLANAFAKQERKDTFASIILQALAWSGSLLDGDRALDSVLTPVAEYVEQGRSDRRHAAIACRLFVQDVGFEQLDSLDLLLKQIVACRAAGWENSLLYRPTSSLLAEEQSTDPASVGPFSVPLEKPSIVYPPPLPHVEIFNSAIISEKSRVDISLPELGSIERCTVYGMVEDLVDVFHTNHKEFVRYMDENFRLSAATFSIHQVLMEVVIANIFRFPNPNRPFLYYPVLIMDLCRQMPKIIPPILGKAFYTIFENIEKMDVEAQARFSTWFSLHISNFDFKWNWKAWFPLLSVGEHTAHSVLVQEVLEKCVRLSYYERVTKAFPAEIDLIPWMPPQPQPSYKYAANGGADQVLVEVADKLLESMRLKQSDDEKLAIVEEIKSKPLSDAMLVGTDDAGMQAATSVVVQCVMQMGSKSFSHMLNSIERHMNLLMHVSQTTEAKAGVIKVVAEFWSQNKQFFIITIEKLLNYKIIDTASVLSWTFDPFGGMGDANRTYIWEILKKTVSKLNSRISQVSSELHTAREQASSMATDMATDEGKGEDQMDAEVTQDVYANTVVTLETSLDELRREQKHLFISVFETFMRAISEQEANESTSELAKTWTLGMMREFGRHVSDAYNIIEFSQCILLVPC
eukprot:Partr_v1_DN28235_c0_g1_i6_m76133 putative nuclear cap binding protein subunit 1